MWKLIVLLIVVGIVDLRKISFREKKKEVILYFILGIITLCFGIYYMTPNHMKIADFVLTYVMNR